jgi:hypothetical protein
MVGKVKNLVFDEFLHTGKATVRNASEAKSALDSVGGVSTEFAQRSWEIDPVVKFQLSDATKDALLEGNITPLKNDLEKPYKLFSEVGLGVKYHFDTESYLSGKLTVSNLDSDLKKSTYKGTLNFFNVDSGGKRITFGLTQEYTPETDAHQSGLQLQIQR